MNKSKALFSVILNHFSMHPARILIMVEIILGMIKVGSVQQQKIALATKTKAKTQSTIRRIQRFFEKEFIDPHVVSRFIFNLFDWDAKITFTMDRTNWKFGETEINFLVVSGIYRGCAIPISWILLPHKGNSNIDVRINVIEKLLMVVPEKQIYSLLADREFIGKGWFKYLRSRGISFCIRLKENMLITDTRNGDKTKLKKAFGYLSFGQCREIRQIIEGVDLRIFATMTAEGELLILAVSENDNLLEAFELYSYRWTIETMFKAFKSSGFNFEDTHQKNVDRLHKIMILATIAYAWSIKIGEIKNSIKPIKIKSNQKPEFSIFNYGLRAMQAVLLKGVLHLEKKLFALLGDIGLKQPISQRLAHVTVVY